MVNNKRVNDEYTNRARKEGYLARSVYKLEEIDQKYDLLSGAKCILDIGCAPGSWLQYLSNNIPSSQTPPNHPDGIVTSASRLSHLPQGEEIRGKPIVIGLDIKTVEISLPGVLTYVQDISDRLGVQSILDENDIEKFDLIISDMAPDTIGNAEIDALRSINLIEKTLRIYDQYLKEGGKFAIKVFMGPGFQELVRDLKATYGASNIITFKPRACRKASKETYLVKRR